MRIHSIEAAFSETVWLFFADHRLGGKGPWIVVMGNDAFVLSYQGN